MTTSSPGRWLPAAIARAAVVLPARSRHSPSEAQDVVEAVAPEPETARAGRHTEPEWGRELYDPAGDDDPLDWLGFTAPDAD